MAPYFKSVGFICGFLTWAIGAGIFIPGVVILSRKPSCHENRSPTNAFPSPPRPPGSIEYNHGGGGRRLAIPAAHYSLYNKANNGGLDCRTGPIVLIILGGVFNICGWVILSVSSCGNNREYKDVEGVPFSPT